MPASGYSLRATVIESLLTAKRPDVPPRVVLRNTAAESAQAVLKLMEHTGAAAAQ